MTAIRTTTMTPSTTNHWRGSHGRLRHFSNLLPKNLRARSNTRAMHGGTTWRRSTMALYRLDRGSILECYTWCTFSQVQRDLGIFITGSHNNRHPAKGCCAPSRWTWFLTRSSATCWRHAGKNSGQIELEKVQFIALLLGHHARHGVSAASDSMRSLKVRDLFAGFLHGRMCGPFRSSVFVNCMRQVMIGNLLLHLALTIASIDRKERRDRGASHRGTNTLQCSSTEHLAPPMHKVVMQAPLRMSTSDLPGAVRCGGTETHHSPHYLSISVAENSRADP